MLSDVVRRAEDFWVSYLSHVALLKDDLIHEGDDDPCSQDDITQGHCLHHQDERTCSYLRIIMTCFRRRL